MSNTTQTKSYYGIRFANHMNTQDKWASSSLVLKKGEIAFLENTDTKEILLVVGNDSEISPKAVVKSLVDETHEYDNNIFYSNSKYSLPIATTSSLGGVTVTGGTSGISINSESGELKNDLVQDIEDNYYVIDKLKVNSLKYDETIGTATFENGINLRTVDKPVLTDSEFIGMTVFNTHVDDNGNKKNGFIGLNNKNQIMITDLNGSTIPTATINASNSEPISGLISLTPNSNIANIVELGSLNITALTAESGAEVDQIISYNGSSNVDIDLSPKPIKVNDVNVYYYNDAEKCYNIQLDGGLSDANKQALDNVLHLEADLSTINSNLTLINDNFVSDIDSPDNKITISKVSSTALYKGTNINLEHAVVPEYTLKAQERFFKGDKLHVQDNSERYDYAVDDEEDLSNKQTFQLVKDIVLDSTGHVQAIIYGNYTWRIAKK